MFKPLLLLLLLTIVPGLETASAATVLERQGAEILSRADNGGSDCSFFLGPLIDEEGSTPFSDAIAAIEQNIAVIAERYPRSCTDVLMQNISLISPQTDTTSRILAILNSRPRQIRPVATTSCEIQESGIETLLNLATDIQHVGQCAPLENGKWKKIGENELLGNPIRYALRKSSEGVHVVLNLNFSQSPQNSTSGTSVDQLVSNEAMMARARECMRAAQPMIKGPEGETIFFDLITPSEASRLPLEVRPGPNNITIDHRIGVRSHSNNYAYDVDCPTIVHELFHLLGLIDEYPGEGDGALCRSVPVPNNIMSRSEEAFNTSVPRNVTCKCTSEACRQGIARPGRIDFLKTPRFANRTTTSFRNSFCTGPTYTSTFAWASATTDAPRSPFSAATSNNGRTLVVTDYYMDLTSWQSIFGMTVECNCPVGNTACVETIRQLAENDSPLDVSECAQFGMSGEDFDWTDEPLQTPRISVDRFTYGIAPKGVPLLHPKQVQRVLGGTCPTIASSYNVCAQYAYVTTPQQCANIPDYCRRPDFHDHP